MDTIMSKTINQDIDHILVSEEQIEQTVTEIAAQIDRDYKARVEEGGKLLLLCILKGSVVFMGDLMKHITLPVEIDFMKVSSYGAATKTTGNVNIILDLMRTDIPTLDILVIEDIVDSGKTLSYLTDYLRLKGAHSVRTCTLLDKPSRREVNFDPDYVGREIPDEFVVGYGLDYAEKYRALPYVGVLKPAVYEKN
ncbi:MAG: hypoxanthine phosphoribosyltransferase [Clostridia bacterium]|nr:hypoxanthine phosphoribosyltransferase [Clostridia bacterium]MBQ4574872.1 hypoxanthine phosphoribosyltransferase [Clostridia bacterium]